MNAQQLWDKSKEYVARRESLNGCCRPCPRCGDRQVQLTGYMDITPAQWRCRVCHHSFEYEPEAK